MGRNREKSLSSRLLRLMLLTFALSFSAIAAGCGGDDEGSPEASEPALAEWSHSGTDGPENWGRLDAAYELCETGKTQSPIDITGGATAASSSGVELDYVPEELVLENNGHAIEARIDEAESSIEIDGEEFGLAQFHVHTPAEERVGGRPFDASIHLVHQSEDGEIAVIGLLVKSGRANPELQKLVDEIPAEIHEETEVSGKLDLTGLLPKGGPVFRYMGSLTTPPCSEEVHWTVFKRPVTMSPAQLEAFHEAYPNNARPIQPRNQRDITLSPAPA